MNELEELEALRKEQGEEDELAELERLRKEQGPLEQESFATRAPAEAWSALVSPIAKLSNTVDSYVVAPWRAGMGKAQEIRKNQDVSDLESIPQIATAMYDQFGEDPSKAPTMGKLMEGYGIPGEKNIPYPKVENFGSPNARFTGGMTSAANIVGAGAGMAMDPMNQIPFGQAGHLLQKSLANTARATRKTGKGVLKAGSQFFGQVRPDDFNYYVDNHPRLKGNDFSGFEPIKENILNDADIVRNRIGQAEIKVRETKEALDTAKKNLTDKINEGMTPSLEDVEMFQKLVDDDKAMQGYLSNKADEALGKLKIKVSTKHLKELVQDEIDSMKVNTSSEAARRAQLEDLILRLDDQGPLMNGPMLRDWMQSIRNELANYQLSPGVYDEELSRRSKKIANRVSEFLKKQGEDGLPGSAPSEYRMIMDLMAPYAKASEDLSEMFSTPQKGASTLKAIHQDAPVIGKDFENKLRNYAEVSETPEVNQLLDKKIEIRNFAKKIKDEGEESFLRKESSDLDWAEQNLDETKRRTKDIRSLTEDNTDAVINNLSHSTTGMTSKSGYADQLKNLEEMVPRPEGSLPYLTQIRDQGVLKRFDQERPATGYIVPAMAGIGGTLGTLMGDVGGSVVGTGAGTLLGTALSKRGGKIARGFIDASMPAGKALTLLENKLKNPSPQFQKYMKYFEKAGNIGSKGMLLYHQILWNNDPEYRKALSEGQ